MFSGEERNRVLEHSSHIFYNMAIATMILSYLATIVLSFDALSFFGIFLMIIILGAIWIVTAVLGCVTFLIVMDGYRAFLMNLGGVIVSLFDAEKMQEITEVVMSAGHYYPIIAVLPPIAISLFFILRGVAHRLKGAKREIITLSIMGAFYVISLILSILLIVRFEGGVA